MSKCLIALFFIAIFSSCEQQEDVKPSTKKEFVSEIAHDGPGDKSKDDDE